MLLLVVYCDDNNDDNDVDDSYCFFCVVAPCCLLLILRPLSSPFLISVASPLYSCVRNKVSRTEQSLIRRQSYNTIVASPTPTTDIDDGDCDDGIRIGTP